MPNILGNRTRDWDKDVERLRNEPKFHLNQSKKGSWLPLQKIKDGQVVHTYNTREEFLEEYTMTDLYAIRVINVIRINKYNHSNRKKEYTRRMVRRKVRGFNWRWIYETEFNVNYIDWHQLEHITDPVRVEDENE